MSKVLVIDEANRGERIVPWDSVSIKRYGFDSGDIDLLDKGEVLFKEGDAFTLEDEDYEVG